jgi:hypothetical protein
MLALCVFARVADAWWASELARPIIFERLSAASHVADYMLFRGLAACALAVGVRGPKRRQLTRAAAQSHRYLRRWSRHGPDFVHMAQLVEAERMRARGRPARALALYERVAAAAQAAGYVHHAALAHERHAGLLEALGRSAEARTRLSRAVDLYRAWGAEGKLRTLRA